MTLPSAEWQYPSCGSCYGDTQYEDGFYDCHDCGLTFDQEDLSAEFTDPDAPPCGNPCDNIWHNSRDLGPYDCKPCVLPKGHTSDHWTDCRPVLEREKKHERPDT